MTDLKTNECIKNLTAAGINPNPGSDGLWCGPIWDTVMCWPAVRAGASFTQQCPPLKGLNHSLTITKVCHSSGRWMGANEADFNQPYGRTNYDECFKDQNGEMIANFPEIIRIAKSAKMIEFLGYGLSVLALCFVLGLYFRSKKLRFYNNSNILHVYSMIAFLIVGVFRLGIYLDFISQKETIIGNNIFCGLVLFILEYGKLCIFAWIFLEVFYAHNKIVWQLFKKDNLWPYLLFGYGLTLVNALIWIVLLWREYGYQMPLCLGDYTSNPTRKYLAYPKYILNSLSLLLLINTVRVLWFKYGDYLSTVEHRRIKKHILISAFLFFLVALPELFQLVDPSRDITAIKFTAYIFSISIVIQGLIVALIFFLLNRDAIDGFRGQSGRDIKGGETALSTIHS